MGRNKRKTAWKEKREQAKKQNVKQDYPQETFKMENKAFEEYYKLQLKDEFPSEADFNRFMNTLRQKLPVTFRVNENVPNYKNFLEKISHPDFIRQMTTDNTEKETKPEEGEVNAGSDEKDKEENEEQKDDKEDNIETIDEQIKLLNIPWYPRKLLWELTTFRKELKKNKAYEKLHKFIQHAFDSGLITRQEVVSMLPPLLLDVKSSDVILDMCAAPGSKTSQLLELLYRDEAEGKNLTQGGVIANDVDESRANMLIHQVHRMNTAGMMVVNHHAQHFPTLKSEGDVKPGENNRFYFDKILADVPCTGDGAIRKIPQKWKKWTANDGICLHPLQLQILMRAMQLVKIGGLVLYSTCSINPIEVNKDEAVLTELFRRANTDAFELVDIQQFVPDLVTRKGLLTWSVIEPKQQQKGMEEEKKGEENGDKKASPQDYFNVYENVDQIPKDYQGLVRASMFPDTLEKMRDVYKIQNSVRLMPHDQNTGGFFVALLRKKNHVVFGGKKDKTKETSKEEEKSQEHSNMQVEKVTEEEDEEAIKELDKEVNEKEALKHALEAEEVVEKEEQKDDGKDKNNQAQNQKKTKQKYNEVKKEEFVGLDQKGWEWIRDYYGLDDKLKDLFVQPGKDTKRIVMVSPGIHKVLGLDKKGLLVKLNMGVKAFSKEKSAKENKCPYRICQDAALALFPLMNKNKIKCSAEEFKFFCQSPSIKYEDIPNVELRNQIKSIGPGACVLYAEKDGPVQDLDCLACLTHPASITPMASKELVNSLKLRYLDI